jgi:isocitrate dehydrogenase
MPNLYGDILSDVAAQITGSVGLAGSANIGDGFAMFEAIHGSAPRIAGKNKANPSGLLLGAIQMLVHIGQHEVAATIQNAWLKTLEDGVHTYDIYKQGISKEVRGTQEFADAIIERLGSKPLQLKPAVYTNALAAFVNTPADVAPAKKDLVGVDVFLHAAHIDADTLATKVLHASQQLPLQLQMITNRGTKVWPDGFPETFCTDHWRCRFKPNDKEISLPYNHVINLLQQINTAGLDIIKTENLYYFNGQPGFTAAQGQ